MGVEVINITGEEDEEPIGTVIDQRQGGDKQPDKPGQPERREEPDLQIEESIETPSEKEMPPPPPAKKDMPWGQRKKSSKKWTN